MLSLEDFADGLRAGRGGKKRLRKRSVEEYVRFVKLGIEANDMTKPLRAAQTPAAWYVAWTAIRRYLVMSGQEDPKESLKASCPPPDQHRRVRRPAPEDSWVRALAATDVLPEPDRSFMWILLSTGLRIGDLLGITREEVEAVLAEGEVVMKEKGGHERLWAPDKESIGPLHNLLGYKWSKLQDLWAEHWKTAQNRVRIALAELCKTAGIPYASPHRFRHTFATALAEQGTSLPYIQHMMGHAESKTTSTYVHPSGATMSRESSKLTGGLKERIQAVRNKVISQG